MSRRIVNLSRATSLKKVMPERITSRNVGEMIGAINADPLLFSSLIEPTVEKLHDYLVRQAINNRKTAKGAVSYAKKKAKGLNLQRHMESDYKEAKKAEGRTSRSLFNRKEEIAKKSFEKIARNIENLAIEGGTPAQAVDRLRAEAERVTQGVNPFAQVENSDVSEIEKMEIAFKLGCIGVAISSINETQNALNKLTGSPPPVEVKAMKKWVKADIGGFLSGGLLGIGGGIGGVIVYGGIGAASASIGALLSGEAQATEGGTE